MDEFSYSDLFNFSNSQPISDAVKMIQELEKVYTKMVDTIESNNKRLAGDMSEVKVNAANLLKSIDTLNNAATKSTDAYSNLAKSTDDLSKSQDTLKNKEAENAKIIVDLKSQIDKLKQAKDNLKKSNEAETGSVDGLKKKLDEATKAYKGMGDATDQAVKDDQLKKIAELDSAYKSANKSINDAKKATEYAAGSYNALAQRLSEGRKALKSMEGGIMGNTQAFKDLQKQVADDNKTLKDWDESIGDGQRNVGNYKQALGNLIPGFSGVAGAIDTATTAGKSFIASPLGLVVAALGLAIGALISYFKGSIEGQDKWNKVVAYGTTLLEYLKDGAEAVGKGIVSVFESPKAAVAGLWEFIKENIVNRFLALPKVFKALNDVILSGFSAKSFKDLANATLQLATGIEDVIGKTTKLTDAAAKEFERRAAIAKKLADLENLIRKEKIRDVVDDAQTELKVNELLEDSKDKLKFADEDRLTKVRQARKLLSDQLKGDLELAQLEIDAQKTRIEQAGGLLIANKKLSEYTNDEIVSIGKVKYELIEQLAQLEAAQINQEAAASQKRKALYKQEQQLIKEIGDAYFDRIKREKQAQLEIDTFVLNASIKRNSAILADEDSSLSQRLDAIKQNSIDGEKLLELARDKDLNALKEEAIAKIELDSATSAKIFNDSTKTLTQQLEMEKSLKEAALMNDARYSEERQIFVTKEKKVSEQYFESLDELNKKSAETAEQNIFKVLARDFAILNDKIQTDGNDALTELNNQYSAGNVSITKFEKERIKITGESTRTKLLAELDYLNTVLKQSGLTSKEIADNELKASNIRKQLSSQTAEQILANETALRSKLNEVAQQGVAFGQTLFQAQIDQNIQGLESQLAAEEDKANKSIALVGNDAQAKAVIEQNLANKRKDIERQIIAEKRKAAIVTKAIAVTETIVNTAKAIVAALPNVPLSIATGVLGALQLATIVATPIPSFWKGTDNAPEGMANVAERGREVGVDKDGNVTMYNKPQVAYLKKGTKILDNSKTESLIQQAKQFGDGYMFDQKTNAFKDYSSSFGRAEKIMETQQIVSALVENKDAIVSAIKSSDQDVWDDNGYRRYTRSENSRVEWLNKKYKF